MSLQHKLLLVLRSVTAMVVAVAIVFVVNMGGGQLAATLGFPGGNTRLAWDLLCIFVAGLLATWALVKLAPRAPRRHAMVLLLLMLVVSIAAVIRLGDDFPGWFTAGLLLCAPLQIVLGMRLALRGRHHSKQYALQDEASRAPPPAS